MDIICYICTIIVIYYCMDKQFTTNQDIILLLSKRIKEYRLAARISQKEMAEISGVSLATISREGACLSVSLSVCYHSTSTRAERSCIQGNVPSF